MPSRSLAGADSPAWKTRCLNCGERFEMHGGADNPHRAYACPAGPVSPKWPSTIKDMDRAGALFDKRLAAFWTKRTTTFEARR